MGSGILIYILGRFSRHLKYSLTRDYSTTNLFGSKLLTLILFENLFTNEIHNLLSKWINLTRKTLYVSLFIVDRFTLNSWYIKASFGELELLTLKLKINNKKHISDKVRERERARERVGSKSGVCPPRLVFGPILFWAFDPKR